ncbi:MAG: hypothetical protein U1F25_19785 [Rubrivivax sp.]
MKATGIGMWPNTLLLALREIRRNLLRSFLTISASSSASPR